MQPQEDKFEVSLVYIEWSKLGLCIVRPYLKTPKIVIIFLKALAGHGEAGLQPWHSGAKKDNSKFEANLPPS